MDIDICSKWDSYAPPMVMVGIVPTRYSYKMIKESGCFVVNIAEKDYQEVFDYLGRVSKRDADKLKDKNVRMENGKVEYVHANENLLNEDGSIDFSKIQVI